MGCANPSAKSGCPRPCEPTRWSAIHFVSWLQWEEVKGTAEYSRPGQEEHGGGMNRGGHRRGVVLLRSGKIMALNCNKRPGTSGRASP